MSKHIERTIQTKQKLIDAFWKLYCEHKIEKITVKMITDEAGFYRSTFYEYFSDVYEVLEEIEKFLLDEYRMAIEKICTAEDISSAQKIGMSLCISYSDYLAVLLGPSGDRKFYYAIKELVIETIQTKFNISAQDKRTEIFFEVFSSSAIALLAYWYNNQEEVSLEEVLSTGANIIQHGVITVLKDFNIPFLK